MQAAQTITIDLNARARFIKEISDGYVGISYLDSITKTVKCIATHNQEFRDGKRGARDAQRAKMHFEAAQLSSGEQRVLSLHLELGMRGKLGSVALAEIKADAVRRTTGGPCAERTYIRHEAALCRRGWLSKDWIPTGTRVLTEEGKWTTRKVRKVTLTPAARLLFSQKTYISTPTPKRPIIERDKSTKREVLTISLSTLCDDKSKFDRRGHVVTGNAEELPAEGNECTSPSSQAPQTVEHQTSNSAPRKAAKKAAAAKSTSARSTRTGIPRTWATARATLLFELYAFFGSDSLVDEFYRVAKLQTDPRYPAAMMTALDWDPIVRRWVEMGWADRRRCLKNEIAPPLRAFCALIAPPGEIPEEKRTEIEYQYAELCEWLAVIPDKIPACVPTRVSDRLARERLRVNMLARAIHVGRTSLAVLTDVDHDLLHQAGHIWDAD